jgi:cytochrome c oxidase subunit 3
MEYTPQQKATRPLLYLGLASIGMAFAGLTSGYVVARSSLMAASNWQTIELPFWFYLSTAAVVLSSLLMYRAQAQLSSGARPVALVASVLGLGLAFAIFQVLGWAELINQRIYFTGEGSKPEASWLYVITWFHWLHVLAGILVVTLMLVRTVRGYYVGTTALRFTLGAQFWHFLGFLWLYLLGFLLILR